MWFKKKAIPFQDFINRIKDLSRIEKYATTVDTMLGVKFDDLTFLPYQILKHDIPELIKQEKFELAIFEIVRLRKPDLSISEVQAYSNHDKLMFYFWIKSQYEAIKELETKYLSSPPDAKLAQAGVAELDVLGDVNLIDALAMGDVLKWDQVRALPYSQVFDKQLKIVIENRINKRLREINKNK